MGVPGLEAGQAIHPLSYFLSSCHVPGLQRWRKHLGNLHLRAKSGKGQGVPQLCTSATRLEFRLLQPRAHCMTLVSLYPSTLTRFPCVHTEGWVSLRVLPTLSD